MNARVMLASLKAFRRLVTDNVCNIRAIAVWDCDGYRTFLPREMQLDLPEPAVGWPQGLSGCARLNWLTKITNKFSSIEGLINVIRADAYALLSDFQHSLFIFLANFFGSKATFS